jgi:gas vesicle protein
MYDYRRGGSVFGAFLLGGVVGAALGLLFAPRSGKETRDIIAEKTEEYWGEGVEFYETGKEKVVETYETGKEKVVESYEVGKEKVVESTEQLRSKIDEARGKLQEQVAKSAEVGKEKVAEAVPAVGSAVDKAAEATKGGFEAAGAKAQDTLDFVAKKAKSDFGASAPEAHPEL